jgi:hypothetical protein
MTEELLDERVRSKDYRLLVMKMFLVGRQSVGWAPRLPVHVSTPDHESRYHDHAPPTRDWGFLFGPSDRRPLSTASTSRSARDSGRVVNSKCLRDSDIFIYLVINLAYSFSVPAGYTTPCTRHQRSQPII